MHGEDREEGFLLDAKYDDWHVLWLFCGPHVSFVNSIFILYFVGNLSPNMIKYGAIYNFANLITLT